MVDNSNIILFSVDCSKLTYISPLAVQDREFQTENWISHLEDYYPDIEAILHDYILHTHYFISDNIQLWLF